MSELNLRNRMLAALPVASLSLGVLMFSGCKGDDTKNTTPPAAVPAAPAPSAAPELPPAPAIPNITTRPSVPDVAPPALPPVPAAPTTAPSVPPAASAAADDANTQAKGLMAQIQDAIKDKKWDDAESLLTKLDGLKDKLSPDLQKQVDSLHTALTAQKAAGGLKLPGGLPGAGDSNK